MKNINDLIIFVLVFSMLLGLFLWAITINEKRYQEIEMRLRQIELTNKTIKEERI